MSEKLLLPDFPEFEDAGAPWDAGRFCDNLDER